MDKQKFEEYIARRYRDQISWYDKKAATNKRLYQVLETLLIMLSVLTPILVAIIQPKILPIIISLAVAILASVLKIFKYQENWINYRTTCETLKKELYFYDAGLNDYSSSKDKEAHFVERVESLISRENTLWLSIHKEEKKARQKTGQ